MTISETEQTESCDWRWSEEHRSICRVIETDSLWGETTCRVWLPGRDSVVRIPASRLKSLESSGTGSSGDIAYIAAAARVADALTQDVLLAPIESSVIPLPHQIRALSRAIANDRVRYLLADEVGLGKTIEAGLIMRELKLRGLVKRTLVIAPKGLVSQWVSEMRFHFGETFQLVLPEDIKTLKRIAPTTSPGNGEKGNLDSEVLPANAWQMFSQVVVPMDSVKPLDKRRGWTAVQVGEHNRERFEDLISAGWDLVIVDEAHRLGGSTDQVARFKLGQGLSEAAPYFLLLSATPHQGKTDAFHRLVSLIDALEFPDVTSVTRERVQPHVIRTEKRRAIDADGKPLFKPRRTQLGPVSWDERHRNQKLLYEAVTEYVRDGYNQAMREKRSYIKAFAKDSRILISTDAGGEGLNLQFCHVVINYDIPWNPMRLEQRIGRVEGGGHE